MPCWGVAPGVSSIGVTRKTAVIAAVVVIAAVAVWQLPVSRWVVTLAEQVRSMGWAGVALFIAIYVVAAVALLPGALLTLAAGFAYGPVGGLLIASPASVVAATVAFFLSRTIFRDWIRQRIDRYPKARALDSAIGANSFKLILLLRLSPLIPFNILNYVLGLSDASAGRYVAASFIGMLPATWLYVYLGSLATTAAQLNEAGQGNSSQKLILTGVGLVATILVVVLVTRAARRALEREVAAKAP